MEGFRRADGTQTLAYPRDFGPHPDYQTEWWYYTGNLGTTDGHRFGYQLTFFRRGLLPPQEWTDRDSSWGTNQVYMGHFALSDIGANEHHAFERFARGSAGLAGAGLDPFQVWLEDWQLIQTGADEYRITASQGDILLDLTLADTRGSIPHGEYGHSKKGPETGNASYYFSQTRLDSSGTIQVENVRYEVKGLSWMDHEFSTSALSQGQIGWDWFSIQLNDGSDLMVFQIRRADGSIDPFSSGTWVDPKGNTLILNRVDFKIQVIDTWRSPSSGAQYPSGWILQVPELKLSLEIQPMMADQEMEVSYTYWEGAVDVSGSVDGESVSGFGYIELTGYAASMEGEF
jgi:predicted secreted hydrolase